MKYDYIVIGAGTGRRHSGDPLPDLSGIRDIDGEGNGLAPHLADLGGYHGRLLGLHVGPLRTPGRRLCQIPWAAPVTAALPTDRILLSSFCARSCSTIRAGSN